MTLTNEAGLAKYADKPPIKRRKEGTKRTRRKSLRIKLREKKSEISCADVNTDNVSPRANNENQIILLVLLAIETGPATPEYTCFKLSTTG